MSKKVLVAITLATALLVTQHTGFTAEPATSTDISDKQMRRIEQLALATLSFSESVRPTINRAAFEQDSLLDHLDFEATDIIRFVTNDIAYQPYAGVLRGAQGTLLARAGNALDQSLLLATLLNEAGYEAVIRGGTLSKQDTQRLLRRLAGGAAPAPWQAKGFDQASSQYLKRTRTLLADRPAGTQRRILTRQQINERIRQDQLQLIAALAAADVALGSDALARQNLAEISQYYWVDYRDGAASSWLPLHPAFGGSPAPAVTVSATFAGDVPAEHTHRIRIELLVDQRFGGKRKTAALMATMEFPSANVAGRSISLMLVPDVHLRKEPPSDDAAALAQTRFLIPMINQAVPTGGRVLSLNGTALPLEAVSVSAAGLFATVGERFESASNALAGLGKSKQEATDLVAMEALRLRITLIHPQRRSRTVERTLYQAPAESQNATADSAAQQRIAMVAELARSHSLGFVTGTLAPGYVLDQMLTTVDAMAPLIHAWTAADIDACESISCLPKPKLDLGPSGANTATMAAKFDQEMPMDADAIVYRDEPTIIRVSLPLFPGAASLAGVFDIVNNSRRAFKVSAEQPVLAPALVLLAGVAETYLEHEFLGFREPQSNLDRFEENAADASRLKVWSDPAQAPPLGEQIATSMVQQALANGSIVVTALPSSIANDAHPGWWQIDPGSGRTLGMTRYGGAVTAEEIGVLVVAVAVLGSATVPLQCALNPYRRNTLSPSGAPRHQRATVLACTYCRLTNTVSLISFRLSLTSSEELSDNVRYCIALQDGWENG